MHNIVMHLHNLSLEGEKRLKKGLCAVGIYYKMKRIRQNARKIKIFAKTIDKPAIL